MAINTLCFSGAGVAGISFVSSLKYLCDIKYIELNKINTFVGCSFGAILSFFLIIGYSIDELYIFCMEFNFDILKSNIYIKNIINNGCINSSENIMYLIKKFFFNKFNIYDCTLKELFDMTKKKIIIIGTNYTLNREEIFDYINTPNISIMKAIEISIAIPGVFKPVFYNSNYYVDGSVTNHYPINYCNKISTFGFLCRPMSSNERNNENDLLHIILNSFLLHANYRIKQIKNDHKFINFGNNINSYPFLTMKKTKIKELIKYGIEMTKEFINSFELIYTDKETQTI